MSGLADSDKRKRIMPGATIMVNGRTLTCVKTSDGGCRSEDNRRCAFYAMDGNGHGYSLCKEYDCVFKVGVDTVRVVFLPMKK